MEDVEVEAGGVTKGLDGVFLLSMIEGCTVEDVEVEVGGVMKDLDGLSFFSGCVRGINSRMELLASPSVIGAENLKFFGINRLYIYDEKFIKQMFLLHFFVRRHNPQCCILVSF